MRIASRMNHNSEYSMSDCFTNRVPCTWFRTKMFLRRAVCGFFSALRKKESHPFYRWLFTLVVSGAGNGACQKEERGKNVSKIKVVSAWRGGCSLHRGSIAAQAGRNQIHDQQ